MEIVEMKNEIMASGWVAEGVEIKRVWTHPEYTSRFTIKGAYDLMTLGKPIRKSKAVKPDYEDKGIGNSEKKKKPKK